MKKFFCLKIQMNLMIFQEKDNEKLTSKESKMKEDNFYATN